MTPSRSNLTPTQPNQMVEHHLTALRRLACQLVTDSHDAEDAVQETCLAALHAPPDRLDRARAWLETVLRNVVRKQARTRRRSLRRERAVARPEEGQATVDILARQQQLTSLTQAVFALPEELQQCVFLRYFEGVPPRQIAQRTGRSVQDVYRDLERAKTRLRRDLEKRDADWRQGLATLVGLKPMASTLALGGAFILTKKIIGSLSALLLISLGVFWYQRDDVDAAAPPNENQAAQLQAIVDTGPLADGAAEERVPEPEAPASGDDGSLAALAPYEFELELITRDTSDLPRPDVQVLLAPLGHPLNAVRTGKEGRITIRWRGRRPRLTMVYACPRDLTNGRRLRRVECHAKVPQRVAMRVRAEQSYVVVRGAGRESVDLTGGGWTLKAGDSFEVFRGGPLCYLQQDREGWFWFTTSYAAPDRAPNDPVEKGFAMSFDDVTETEVEGGGNTLRKRTIQGTVRDPLGRPVAKALVRGRNSRVRTNAKGEFKLTLHARDGSDIMIHAGGGDHGIASHKLNVHTGTKYRWDTRLDRGTELTGQLVDADGKPLSGWRVEIEPEDRGSAAGFIDGTKTDKQGRFAIPNVIDRGYRMAIFAPSSAIPAMQEGPLHPRRPHFLTVVTKGEAGTFHAKPCDEAGKPLAKASAQLWHAGTGEGVFCRELRKPLRLTAGTYRLSFQAPGFNPTAERSAVILPNQDTTLGEVYLGEPTDIDVRKLDDKAKLYFLHDAVPSYVSAQFHRFVYVPPGSYRGIRGDRSLDFEVREGENTAPEALWRKKK